ncbi:MAG: pyridoxamine 5'-phosphate oxidase family protein [Geobacter sp.]|nr:pyridoxamine 5'-phosphate oxidase family protein [Geobacter sp.]
MRRKEREITDRGAIDAIIRSCRVCRLAMSDNGQPYVVPLSFGYDGTFLYFHAAREGRKVEILKKNSRVCFEFEILEEVVTASQACNWSMRYQSVIGFGSAEIVIEPAARIAALNCIMGQYSGSSWTFDEQALAATLVVRVRIGEIGGKARL